MEILSTAQTARMLNISAATVRNWVRQGYLSPISGTATAFSPDEVTALKRKIESGEVNRLRQRANKRSTSSLLTPDEYITDKSFIDELETVRNTISENRLNLELSLFVLAMRLLALNNEVIINDPARLFDTTSEFQWHRNSIKNEMQVWQQELVNSHNLPSDVCSSLFHSLKTVSHSDTLGILYQSLLYEGDKSRKGSYFTPPAIISQIFSDYRDRDGLFLDPCCGTGQFLLCAAQSGYDRPEQLCGFDIDPVAVKIARLNLLLAFNGREFSPRIFQANTLTEITSDIACKINAATTGFSLIATNPPWGAYMDNEVHTIQKLYPSITSGESFSCFLVKSLELSEPDGRISFILPESFLNIRTHSDIRNYILTHASVTEIHHLGRIFKGVFTPVIRLDLLNRPPDRNQPVTIRFKDHHHTVPQNTFLNTRHYTFTVFGTKQEQNILNTLMDKPHITLAGRADWALGIVTGNNSKFISPVKAKGMEPIYRGSDIEPYRLKEPSGYIRFTPELFQQTAPEHLYRAREKLIYRFISDTPIVAWDNRQSLTLNSANILIPKPDTYPAKVFLALLNSALYRFIFRRMFATRKVLRGDLECLPFPILDSETIGKLEHLATRAIEGRDVTGEIDALVIQAAGLSEEQAFIIEADSR